ncbi:uncharacterized protein CIMG_09915 [Coccidioides immitis RS]|uniref:Nucleolar protein Dnt1-like N-terminal domain-containing protein n=2 Tax=Coccidioides immitis TaxID=5501 RepID=J3K0E3_COCIM|nr:uncharacterized protein CIMG_09915 [Coccidioides immitis RS]EAS27310.3 hypothetical protein CIMG_09915 [Coccidioides immitis RS]KMP09272.1 hypothetical protein CIRG_09442 [Coccidioides immitis RMSCC 2394]TPX20150.1 hypothetical protein DIZ76_016038 [Coccidioides immitis]
MVLLRAVVKVPPPDVVGRETSAVDPHDVRSMMVLVPDPEQETLVQLAARISRMFTKLHPAAPPLRIKKLVDDERPTVDLDLDLTVADVFVNKGHAASSASDQWATIRVLQHPTTRRIRYRSVVQDWTPAAENDGRALSARRRALPPIPLFSQRPSAALQSQPGHVRTSIESDNGHAVARPSARGGGFQANPVPATPTSGHAARKRKRSPSSQRRLTDDESLPNEQISLSPNFAVAIRSSLSSNCELVNSDQTTDVLESCADSSPRPSGRPPLRVCYGASVDGDGELLRTATAQQRRSTVNLIPTPPARANSTSTRPNTANGRSAHANSVDGTSTRIRATRSSTSPQTTTTVEGRPSQARTRSNNESSQTAATAAATAEDAPTLIRAGSNDASSQATTPAEDVSTRTRTPGNEASLQDTTVESASTRARPTENSPLTRASTADGLSKRTRARSRNTRSQTATTNDTSTQPTSNVAVVINISDPGSIERPAKRRQTNNKRANGAVSGEQNSNHPGTEKAGSDSDVQMIDASPSKYARSTKNAKSGTKRSSKRKGIAKQDKTGESKCFIDLTAAGPEPKIDDPSTSANGGEDQTATQQNQNARKIAGLLRGSRLFVPNPDIEILGDGEKRESATESKSKSSKKAPESKGQETRKVDGPSTRVSSPAARRGFTSKFPDWVTEAWFDNHDRERVLEKELEDARKQGRPTRELQQRALVLDLTKQLHAAEQRGLVIQAPRLRTRVENAQKDLDDMMTEVDRQDTDNAVACDVPGGSSPILTAPAHAGDEDDDTAHQVPQVARSAQEAPTPSKSANSESGANATSGMSVAVTSPVNESATGRATTPASRLGTNGKNLTLDKDSPAVADDAESINYAEKGSAKDVFKKTEKEAKKRALEKKAFSPGVVDDISTGSDSDPSNFDLIPDSLPANVNNSDSEYVGKDLFKDLGFDAHSENNSHSKVKPAAADEASKASGAKRKATQPKTPAQSKKAAKSNRSGVASSPLRASKAESSGSISFSQPAPTSSRTSLPSAMANNIFAPRDRKPSRPSLKALRDEHIPNNASITSSPNAGPGTPTNKATPPASKSFIKHGLTFLGAAASRPFLRQM